MCEENHCWINGHMCVCVCEWVTLCDPMDYSLPGSSVRGILQARIQEWVAIPSSRGSSWPRDRTRISCNSCIGRWFLYHCAAWEGQMATSSKIFITCTVHMCVDYLVKNPAVCRGCLYPLCNHDGQYLGKTVIYCWEDKRNYSLKVTPGIMKKSRLPPIRLYPFLSNKPHFTEILNIVIMPWLCPARSSSPYGKRQFLAFSNCCLCVGLR